MKGCTSSIGDRWEAVFATNITLQKKQSFPAKVLFENLPNPLLCIFIERIKHMYTLLPPKYKHYHIYPE